MIDFQERLQIKEQDQVQSQHWNQDATTIFPCYILFWWLGRVWAYSFMILSDDMAQDNNAWVQHVMSRLLSEDILALLRKIGAPPMIRAIIFSDNCAKQFKCRFHFGWVADAKIWARDVFGEFTGARLVVERHYFGPSHGNNSSDSEGGICKSYVRMMVDNQQWLFVASSRDLCQKLEKGIRFILREATSEESAPFLAARNEASVGLDKLIMTKVGRALDWTSWQRRQVTRLGRCWGMT